MRTRIKVSEKANGDKMYQPQVKDNLTILDVVLFLPALIWFNKFTWTYTGLNTYLNDDVFALHPLHCHPDSLEHNHYIRQCNVKEGLWFNTLEGAKFYLDTYIKNTNTNKIKDEANTVKKEYYIEKTKIKEI